MIARGKRRAPRGASPLVSRNQLKGALKVRNTIAIISLFQSFTIITRFTQGRRASRLPLAIVFRAFGAAKTDPTFRAFGAAKSDPTFGAFGAAKTDPTLRQSYPT